MSKDILEAIHELKYWFADKGLEIEMIKVNGKLYIDGDEIETIDGVRITDTIYEHDATHWVRSDDGLLGNNSSDAEELPL